MRRLLLPLLALLLFSAPSLRAADVKMDEASKKATAKALEWLKTKQNADGSFSDGRYPHNTAITSFALLAFMSQGHLPGQGTYGPEVAKGCRFLLSSSRASDGYLVGARGGNMYCHAMATLALAELFGMTNDEEIKPVLEKATNLIIKSQNKEGGWRYEPQPTGADISVTIMQVMALRAAKNSGMHVPDETMKKAIEYINRCYNAPTGGFTYQPGSRPGFARTAAGVCVLQLSGNYDAKQIGKAVEYLKANFDSREHFWYGHYYATHGMHQVGGKEWEEWYTRFKDMVLPLQNADGYWNAKDREGVGMVYQTSIAVISLSVPLNYLPIFQR
ncbi:MAG: terpene cyclase/mutase family protein [Planctomycetia bacterium]|nr:terpene cyclase/mutase family protein [Planctomycetia bacterium]